MAKLLLTITGKKDRDEVHKIILDSLQKEGINPEAISSDSFRFYTNISKAQKAMRSAVKAGIKKSRITLKSIPSWKN